MTVPDDRPGSPGVPEPPQGPGRPGIGRTRLTDVLEAGRRRGFLGTTPGGDVLAHSRGFADAVLAARRDGEPPGRALDLGSGGGVPGLVLAALWPQSKLVLVDGSSGRCAFLREAVKGLGWADRVEVVEARAEDIGRQEAWRERLEVVVARAFAGPAVTAECAAPLVAVGGFVVVSEPPAVSPGEVDRWASVALGQLGLQVEGPTQAGGFGFRVLRKVSACPQRYPRRVGIPAKRPLF